MRFSLLLLLLPGALQILGADPGKGESFNLVWWPSTHLNGKFGGVAPAANRPKAVLYLGRFDSSPASASRGSFTVTWTGRIDVDGDEELRFGAFLAGNLQVTVDGEDVLRWSNRGKEAWCESPKGLSRAAGTYPIRIVFSSIADSAARLQLGWSGKSFSQEPIPRLSLHTSAAEVSEEWRLTQRGNADES